MERRRLIRPIAWIMTLVMILSVFSGMTAFAATGTLTRNTTTRHQVCTALSAKAKAYYTGSYTYAKLSQLQGVYSPNDSWAATQNNALYTSLKTLMTNTHSVYAQYNPTGETKDELSYLWDYTDACAGSSQYLYFYTDISADDYGNSAMQREHVWPESKASYFQEGGGSDLHHLRPSIGTVNGNKSNFAFANVREDYSSYKTTVIDGADVIWYKQTVSNPADGVIEVRDNIKGDVARILMYIWCRWGEPNLYSDVDESKCPTMDSKDNGDNQTGLRVIEDMETLLEWMEMDPVDTWEMARNDQIENFQGNRNVFIDYPELAWMVLGQDPPQDMTTPSGEASQGSSTPAYTITAVANDSLYGSVSVSGNVITAKPATGYYTAGYSIVSGTATVTQSGNTFTVSASSNCVIRILFKAKANVTLTYSVPAGVTQASTTASSGTGVTLPKPSGTPTADAYDYSFVGWVDAQVTDSTGMPTVYAAGSTYTLTANTTLYALYTYRAVGGEGYYALVESENQLVDGSEYIIVSSTSNNAMSTTQNSNNRGQASVIKDSTASTVTFNANAGVVELLLYRGDLNDTYSFYDSVAGGYLYAASSTNNYLRTEKTLSENSSFVITLNSDGTATLVAQGSNTRNMILYNPTSSIFSCYASATTTKPVCLYVKTFGETSFYTTVLKEKCSHSYTSATKEATCTVAGYTTYTCFKCGYSYTEEIPATGHSYSSKVTTAASCTAAGVMTYTCSKCGNSYTEAIPAKGHSYSSTVLKESTCTVAGQVRYTCSICGNSYTEALPLLEHSYTSKITQQATCSAAGVMTYNCSKCGNSYTEEIPMVDHSYSNGICSVCGVQSTAPNYSLVTSVSDLTSGKYVIIVKAGGTYASKYPYTYYAMKGANSGNYLASAPADSYVGENLSQTISVADTSLVWNVTVSGSTVSLTSSEGKGLYCSSWGSSANLSSSATAWTATYNNSSKTVSLSVKIWSYLQYYFGLRDDSSTAGSNGLPVFSTGDSGSTSSYRLYFYKEVASTIHKHAGTAVPGSAATCTENGAVAYWTCTCGKYFSDSACTKEIALADTVIPATGHTNGYVDNGDGTHDLVCSVCGTVFADNEKHSFVNGACACGVLENVEPTLDSNISIGETLSLESDLTMNLRIKTAQLTNYDLSTIRLVVERDIYNSDGTVTVETRNLTDYTIKDSRVVFAYTGISAAQMNDEIRAVLYIKDASGKEYMSKQKVTSVAIYSDLMLGVSAGNTKLITLIMDMLNYGTAAQLYFNRHADALACNAFESFKTYASYASTDLSAALEDLSGTISTGNSSATISQSLDLSTRIGITYKVKLPSGVDAASASLIVKDENGKELESFDLSTGTYDSKGRYCVTYFGSTSREMRKLLYATVMVDGAPISATYTYSISTYAHTIANTAGMPDSLVSLTKLMVIYGDSADAYFS